MAAPVYIGGVALPSDDSLALEISDDDPFIVDRSGPIFQTTDDLKKLLPAVLRSGTSPLRDAWLQTWGRGALAAQSRVGFTLEAQATPRFAEGIWLDAYGSLVSKPRAPGEDDQTYRARLLTGVALVTPVAIKAAVNAILADLHLPALIYNEPAVDKAFCGPATISDPPSPNASQQIIGTLQTWFAFTQPAIPISSFPTPNQSVYYGKNLRFWANYSGITGNQYIGAFSAPLGAGFWIIAQGPVGDDSLTPRSEPLSFSVGYSGAVGLQPSDFVQGLTSVARTQSPLPSAQTIVGANVVYHRPFYVQSSATAVTIRVGNRVYSGNPIGLSSFVADFALYTSDGAGNATGAALGFWPGVTVPADGSLLNIGTAPATRGPDGKVVLVHSIPNGPTVATTFAPVTWGSYSAGTLTVNPPPAITGADTSPALDIRLDFATNAPVRVNVRGDDLAIGYNSTYDGSAFYQLGAVQDWAVDVIGSYVLGSLQSFASYLVNTPMWDAYVPGNTEVIQVGLNDLAYNNLATMQGYARTINSQLRALGAARVYFCTVAPQTVYGGTDTVRTNYNSWLFTQVNSGMNINGVIDLAATQGQGGLADNAVTTSLYFTFDSGDGTHPSQAGQDQIRAAVLAKLGTAPSPLAGIAYGYVPQAFDTVVDRVNSEVTRRRAAGVPWVFMIDLPATNAI